MDCNKCRQNIPLIPGDELDRETIAQVISHVETCEACREELNKYTFLTDLLHSMRDLDDIDFNWEQFSAATHKRALARREKLRNSRKFAGITVLKYAVAASLFVSALMMFSVGIYRKYEPAEMVAHKEKLSSESELEPVHVSKFEKLHEINPEEVAGFIRYPQPRVKVDAPVIFENETIRQNRSWIGIQVRNMPEEKVIIESIIEGGPAQGTELQKNDIIIICADEPISDVVQLQRVIAPLSPGEQVTLVIVRDGKEIKTTVKTAKTPHQL